MFTFIVNCLQRFLQEFGLVEANLPIGRCIVLPSLALSESHVISVQASFSHILVSCCRFDQLDCCGGRRALTSRIA